MCSIVFFGETAAVKIIFRYHFANALLTSAINNSHVWANGYVC